MKNSHKLFTLLFFITMLYSCSPENLVDEEPEAIEDVYATGGNDSSTVDDDRDGD